MAARVFLLATRPLNNCLKPLFQSAKLVQRVVQPLSAAYATDTSKGLGQFFDDPENWGVTKIVSGRPWKLEELRQKNNVDLHKLWYILLKERNVIMTMEEEYKRRFIVFPNPERLEKVEESMENLIEVVQERDAAVNELEKGESQEPKKRFVRNVLGLGYMKRETEHYKPIEYDEELRDTYARNGKWQTPYKQILRERQLRHMRYTRHKKEEYIEETKKQFPNADLTEEEEELEALNRHQLPPGRLR